MTEKILILIFSTLYLSTFITRNILVMKRTQQRIRSRDRLVTTSIIFSTLYFLVAIFSTFSEKWYHYMGSIKLPRSQLVSYSGFLLFGVSIVLIWIVSAQLKNSWRVGIAKNQRTQLISEGIYAYIRNPYFLSYYIMFFGLLLIRPSVIQFAQLFATVAIFHRMVLKEEIHLMSMHGEEYKTYKNKTGRYIPRIGYRETL